MKDLLPLKEIRINQCRRKFKKEVKNEYQECIHSEQQERNQGNSVKEKWKNLENGAGRRSPTYVWQEQEIGKCLDR